MRPRSILLDYPSPEPPKPVTARRKPSAKKAIKEQVARIRAELKKLEDLL